VQYATDNSTRAGSALGASAGGGSRKERESVVVCRQQLIYRLCATEEGEVFTHGDVVKAHLALALVLILIGIGGAL